MKDNAPHEVLGVPRNATTEQIRKAFRKRARVLHPDIDPTPGAAERFMALKAAHDEMQRLVERGEQPWDVISAPREQQAKVDFDYESLYDNAPSWRTYVRPIGYAGATLFWVMLFCAWMAWLDGAASRCNEPRQETPRVHIIQPAPMVPPASK